MRIRTWTLASMVMVGAMALTASLMQGLRFDSVAVLAMLIGVWVCTVWLLRKVWMALLLCAVCIPAGVGIPLPFLWKVEMLTWLMLTIAGLAVLQRMVGNEANTGHRFRHYAILLLPILAIVIRVIVDMPGSSQMSSRGGLSVALSYVAGVLAFPFGLWIGWRERPCKRDVAIVMGFGVLAYAIHVVLGSLQIQMQMAWDPEQFYGPRLYRGYLFDAPAWLLLSCVLGLTIARARANQLVELLLFTMFGLMGLCVALVSIHRAFPIYALVIMALTAWTHHRVKYLALVVVTIGTLVVATLGLYARGVYLPEYFRRPMSVFTGSVLKGTGGEYGWEHTFRAKRMDEFLATVRANPLTGRGFSYKSSEMNREVETAGHFALLQSYHNSFLTVISACGVPFGVTFALVVFWLSVRSMVWVRRLEKGDTKLMAVALMGFLLVSLMHASVQGGGLFLGRCLLVLGILCGLQDRAESPDADRPATEPAT